jgi:hypothetical protein
MRLPWEEKVRRKKPWMLCWNFKKRQINK